jgi:hypothetical protein
MAAAYAGASFGTDEMTDALTALASDDIQINEAGLAAIATYVFPHGMRFPVHIRRYTLNNWVETSNARVAQLRSGAPPCWQGWHGLGGKTKEGRFESDNRYCGRAH